MDDEIHQVFDPWVEKAALFLDLTPEEVWEKPMIEIIYKLCKIIENRVEKGE